MTKEEAAKILEYPVQKWSLEWDEREDGLEYCEAIEMAVEVLRSPASQPPNDPLTLEELREMDGEPVWDNSGNCFLVRINVHGTDGYGADKFATYTKLDILCKRGLYRRKPEEWTT